MVPHAVITASAPPETSPLTQSQYDLVLYAIVVAGFALVAGFLYALTSKDEVSRRYRPAVIASMCICAVAALSYVVLLVKTDSGYTLQGSLYQPNSDAAFSMSARYMDWTVTVPILVTELLAVSTLVGRKLSAVRASSIGAAVLMIVTGYLGTQVFDNGGSTFWLWLWWAISMVFFVYLYLALVPAVAASARAMGQASGRTYALAATLLLTTFVVYPIVYLIPVFFHGGWWTTSMQLAFSTADVVAKVGFGMLIHKVAKLRTAEDIAAEATTHPGPVWVNHERLALAGAVGSRLSQHGGSHNGKRAETDDAGRR